MPDEPSDRPGSLPEDVREHLGRKLRSELRLGGEDQPAFLGDDALPPRFATLVHQLERREKSAQQGVEAIRREFDLPEE